MAFEFGRLDRPLDVNVRELARAELDRAIAQVGETGFELGEALRGVRRRLKRVRAILKLVRPAFPAYAEENGRLRQIGVGVSGLRDAAALVDAADTLRRGLGDEHREALAGFRAQLARRAESVEAGLPRLVLLADLRESLLEMQSRAANWELTRTDPGAALKGFMRTYRRARRGYRASRADAQDEVLHEWRKHVKDHYSHLALLRGVAPAIAGTRRMRVKRLSDVLGDHQDLWVLERAQNEGNLERPPELVAPLSAAKTRLRNKALRLGAVLLSEAPVVVEDRWRAYVDEWRVLPKMSRVR